MSWHFFAGAGGAYSERISSDFNAVCAVKTE